MGKMLWGTSPEGERIYRYTIEGETGMQATLTNLGANLISLKLPVSGEQAATAPKTGETLFQYVSRKITSQAQSLVDVVLGYDKPADYLDNAPYFGCCVAPSANRIGGASFVLNGRTYRLEQNDGKNNLHSGSDGLYQRIWQMEDISENSVCFSFKKKDMDMGFPGNLKITVRYTLTPENELRIEYTGLSDADTVFNPTNHSYFNLAGHDSGSAMNQLVWVNARQFTVTDQNSVPDGTLADVAGTPMDFTTPKAMSPEIDSDYQQLTWAKGYDHNYVLDIPEGQLSLAASLEDPASGRKMEVYTDLPGMQLYAGNYIAPDTSGKGGCLYQPRSGICFETQYFPNAVNIPAFSQPIAKAGEEKRTTTVYRFSGIGNSLVQ